jgi:hypothetical protein
MHDYLIEVPDAHLTAADLPISLGSTRSPV